MRYFIDTEYNWDPKNGRLLPLSLALVAEDGREFYAVIDYDVRQKHVMTEFVQQHVLPVLEATEADYSTVGSWYGYRPDSALPPMIRDFIRDDPEFWGDYAAFDYVVLSMLMGAFEDWPQGWPMYIKDLQQIGGTVPASETPHNALSDARAIRDWFRGK